MTTKTAHKRLNITLPEDTLRLIDGVAPKGGRSRFLSEAVRFYVQERGKAELRKLLKEGASVHAQRDLSLAADWYPIENDACLPDRKR
ncbi:MAG: ribbon-helix-helix domain-containing protein [Candidatus Sumerlaeaceae bacterium]